MITQHTIHNLQELHYFINTHLTSLLEKPILLLKGDLGAGKTTFVKSLFHAIGEDENQVISPTFPIILEYPTTKYGTIYHIDLYRINHQDELLNIGIFELIKSQRCLIEWPEILEHSLSNTHKLLIFNPTSNPDIRSITYHDI